MLSLLSVRNIVLIDELEVHFGEGLNVLSGETGAGKSILLAALGLALGYRAEVRLLRSGCDEGSVSAIFSLNSSDSGLANDIAEILNTHGIADMFDSSDDIILRRNLNASGKSRAFFNDTPISVGVLREIGSSLMEVQGHFEQQGLLDVSNHSEFLDSFADLQSELSDYKKSYTEYHEVHKKLTESLAHSQTQQQELETLNYSIQELQIISVAEGEEQRLDKLRRSLKNWENLQHAAQALELDMQADDGLEARLQNHIKALEKPEFIDDEIATQALQALRSSLEQAVDAAAYLQSYQQNAQQGEQSLEEVEDKLFNLRSLARKHQCQVSELPQILEKLQSQADALTNIHHHITEQKQHHQKLLEHCSKAAENISQIRHSTAKNLDQHIASILPELKLEKAEFSTQITTDKENINSNGIDKITFIVKTNPQSQPAPIGKIASAGELSRFLLALRSALANKQDAKNNSTPKNKTLVFDEVDSGIGGATAHAVGQKLNHLAQKRQVILITHSAQAAAFAQHHFFVGKNTNENATQTSINKLNHNLRINEIARMLSGETISTAAIEQAQKLIQDAQA